MKIGSAFPSKWLRADDLPEGQHVKAVIDHVEVEQVGQNSGEDDVKPVVYFQGKSKGLVLNKTNATTIQGAYGDETDDWAGRPVLLYATETSFGGKMVPCVRVKIPKPGAAPSAGRRDPGRAGRDTVSEAPEADGDGGDLGKSMNEREIPF